MSGAFDEAVRAHDARVAEVGPIWIGGEPTYTDRTSLAGEWTRDALGETKEARARALVARLAPTWPGGVLVRCVGRQYEGEPRPRFAYGIFARRDGAPIFGGPADPLISGESGSRGDAVREARALRDALAARLGGHVVDCDGESMPFRLAVGAVEVGDPRLHARSLHEVPTPRDGLCDVLASEGVRLVRVGIEAHGEGFVPRVELPDCGDVEGFLDMLAVLAEACGEVSPRALVIAGFPPRADARFAFTTVTPDPAVIEINLAPAPDVTTFLAWNRAIDQAAADEGLSPMRFTYTGDVLDSGGGGHLTLGGPSADESPFFRALHLLPELVAYMQRHPSLSYLFAVDAIGPWSQSPRSDEGVRGMVGELALALALTRRSTLSREALWATLAPFLADATGNAHRAEINVEKLWSPLPLRGHLGVVELRSFRMARTPERAAALACLVRAVCAMLSQAPQGASLVAWGDALHDRFALPFELERDLERVFDDLERAGLGLGALVRGRLLDTADRELGVVQHGDATLAFRRAIEPWPLVGDSSSQDARGARWIDGSTQRVELLVQSMERPRVSASGYALTLREVGGHEAEGRLWLGAIRRRAFVPSPGLHPTLEATSPLVVELWLPGDALATRVALHDWRPGGGAYDGLPRDDDDALARREERVVVSREEVATRSVKEPPAAAQSAYCLDLRWCAALDEAMSRFSEG